MAKHSAEKKWLKHHFPLEEKEHLFLNFKGSHWRPKHDAQAQRVAVAGALYEIICGVSRESSRTLGMICRVMG